MAKRNFQASHDGRTIGPSFFPGKLPLLEYEVLHRDKGERAEDDIVQNQDPNYCGSNGNATHFMSISVVIQERLRNLLRCHVHPGGNGEYVLLVVPNLVHEVALNEQVEVRALQRRPGNALNRKVLQSVIYLFSNCLGQDSRDTCD